MDGEQVSIQVQDTPGAEVRLLLPWTVTRFCSLVLTVGGRANMVKFREELWLIHG